MLLTRPAIGFLGAALISILLAPLVKFQTGIIFPQWIASLAAVLAGLRIRKRIQFLRLGISVGLVSMALIFADQIFEIAKLYDCSFELESALSFSMESSPR